MEERRGKSRRMRSTKSKAEMHSFSHIKESNFVIKELRSIQFEVVVSARGCLTQAAWTLSLETFHLSRSDESANNQRCHSIFSYIKQTPVLMHYKDGEDYRSNNTANS